MLQKNAVLAKDQKDASMVLSISEVFKFLMINRNFRVAAVVKLGDFTAAESLKVSSIVRSKLAEYLHMSKESLVHLSTNNDGLVFFGEGNNVDTLRLLLAPSLNSIQLAISEFSLSQIILTYVVLRDDSDLISEITLTEMIKRLTDYDLLMMKREYCNSIISSYKVLLTESTGETAVHCERIKMYNSKLATKMGLTKEDIYAAETVGWLHDIGKVSIEDSILNKPGKLSEEEMARMYEHSTLGWRFVKCIPDLDQVSLGIKHHHEYFNGNGYPDKISGDQIPLLSRIVSVTDAFDTMISKRVYKEPRSVDYAVSELKRCSGTQFDPRIVNLFLELLAEGELDTILNTYYLR